MNQRPSRVFFAVTMIGLGLIGLIQRDFPPIWTGVYKSLPAREVLVYLCAFVSLATGTGLLVPRTAAVAARALLIYLLSWLVLFRIPHVFLAPTVEATWWECGDTAVMAAAAWVLYAGFAGDQSSGDRGLRLARMSYGLGLIPFGIAHFTYLKETVADVPGWLPWHVAWAYVTGTAFIAAGLGVLSGVYARLAAVLSAWMMGLFTLLVWVPIVVAGPSAFQWTEFVNSWALTAAAWVVADSYS
ncbi:MAG TPA: hypothetical protein VGU74_10765 [Gemmatimonadales bacterium]|nr:hypothetical protein [Gemmatimonadales bacterium]